MPHSTIFLVLLGIALLAFYAGQRKIHHLALVSAHKQHSRSVFHGNYVALWTVLPAILILFGWISLSPLLLDYNLSQYLAQYDIQGADRSLTAARVFSFASGSLDASIANDIELGAVDYINAWQQRYERYVTLLIAASIAVGFMWALRRVSVRFTARHHLERLTLIVMIIASIIAILTTIGIILSLLFETLRFFETVSVSEFLTGLKWSPQMAIRADQAGSSGAFGAIPLFAGTLLITFLAMCVAVPIGVMTAIYLSEYATSSVRSIVKPALELLAGIPTVVYGFFAAIVVAPLLRDGGAQLGLAVSSESALAAGLVMGIMIIPFVSSLSDDVIRAVPQTLRDGSSALGATSAETIRQVVLPAALPGIVSAILLAISRAIGETMIVVMAAGVAANLTANPLESVTTITVQIVMLLVGDQEFDSPKTLAAFALGMMLFLITLALNVIALYVVRRFREEYE